jgi:hypothetical protein
MPAMMRPNIGLVYQPEAVAVAMRFDDEIEMLRAALGCFEIEVAGDEDLPAIRRLDKELTATAAMREDQKTPHAES